jgi:1-acyl-sn-glycerol-3-phosphate acyltransferase
MLYQSLRPFVTTAVNVFYKDVEVTNVEALNRRGPTLLVANHTNAFLDAVVVQIFVKHKVYSIARGDVFKNPRVAKILGGLGIIPIYRRQDGVGEMMKNEETFERSIGLLSKGETIIMYPEGDCITEKRLRKLRKGAARIVLRAESENNCNLDLQVIPIGLNYSSHHNFRSRLFINVGEPMSVQDYARQYLEDNAKAMNRFTQDLEDRMRNLLVEVEHADDDEFYEEALKVYKPILKMQLGFHPRSILHDHDADVLLAKAVNYARHHHHQQLSGLKHRMANYSHQLQQLGIPLQHFSREKVNSISLLNVTGEGVLQAFGWPLHIVGLLLNYWPYRFAYTTANKKVKQRHFHASVNFAIGMFGWLFYYLFQLLAIGIVSRSLSVTLGFALLIPFSGWFSLRFYSFLKKARANSKIISLLHHNKAKAQQLLAEREELIAGLEEMIENVTLNAGSLIEKFKKKNSEG